MLAKLKQLLQYLQNNLNEQKIASVENLHQAALSWQEVPRLPIIAMYPYPEKAQFQPFPHGQIFDDPEKMLFNQLVNAFDSSLYLSDQIGDDLPATIRPDFGCVLIPSMFGANIEQVENNPPWVRHIEKDFSYSQVIDVDPLDFTPGWIPKVVSQYKFYHDVIRDYPQLSTIVNITLPDLQGPFDNLELIRGSDIFLDMYSQKALFLEAMGILTKTQIELAKYLAQYTDEKFPHFTHQHNFPLKGGILIRADTSIMVSPAMYREMIAPFDQQILELFGGGIHSCGDVNRFIPEYLLLKSIECFDFGQSELNDVESIYQLVREKKIPLMRIAVTEKELTSGSILKKYPTGVSLIFRAKSFEHAKKVIASYKASVQQ